VLDRLVALRRVKRVQPVTETARTRRKIYRIADNLLAFYLGVVTRYRTEIEAGLGPAILPVIEESIDDHQGPRWEAMFRDHVRRLAAAGELGERIVAVGPFWTTDGQHEIDVVVLAGRSRTPVLVGEAEWARQVSAPRLVTNLLRKAAALPDPADDLRVLLCARESVVGATEDVLVVTSHDIFS
jgi:AAA+ ATPase superfamily predicted ATPase